MGKAEQIAQLRSDLNLLHEDIWQTNVRVSELVNGFNEFKLKLAELHNIEYEIHAMLEVFLRSRGQSLAQVLNERNKQQTIMTEGANGDSGDASS